MKKTTNANIAGRVFTLEDDAYRELTAYLDAVKKTLQSNPDKDEILADIESAIVEHLLEALTEHKQVVTVSDIEILKETMGSPAAFGEGEMEGDVLPLEEHGPKKLYRNPDDMVIAGVASGLAAYLGIDPVFVRIFFVLATIFWGWGIMLYIILWIVMPEAKTVSDKLRMQGRPVTIEKIEEYASSIAERAKKETKDAVARVKSQRGPWKRVLLAPFALLGAVLRGIGNGLRRLGPIVRVFIGTVLALGATCAAIASGIFIFGFFLRPEQFQRQFDIMTLTGPHLPLVVAIVLYALVVIPAIFILLGGLALILKKKLTPLWLSLPLLLVWIGAVTYGGIMALDIIPNIQTIERTEQNQGPITEETYTMEPFERIVLGDAHRVTVLQGDTYEVVAQGPEQTIQDTTFSVEADTLRVRENSRFCFFCHRPALDITITAPTLSTIALYEAAEGTIPDFTQSQPMELKLSGASKGTMQVTAPAIDMRISGASTLTLSGATEEMTALISGASRLSAERVQAKTVHLTLSGASTAKVQATEALTGSASGASTVWYNPSVETISVDTSGSSDLRIFETDRTQE